MNISISYVSISITGQSGGGTPCAGGDCKKPGGVDKAKETVGNEVRQRAHAFNELRQALKAGNVDDAKKAFEALQKNLQEATDKSGQNPFAPDSKLGKKLAAIGSALESGDLSAANQAFRAFTHEMRHTHRAHREDGDHDEHSTPATTTSTSALNTAAANPGLNVTA